MVSLEFITPKKSPTPDMNCCVYENDIKTVMATWTQTVRQAKMLMSMTITSFHSDRQIFNLKKTTIAYIAGYFFTRLKLLKHLLVV